MTLFCLLLLITSMQQFTWKQFIQLPYSRDLALTNFQLLLHIKHELSRKSYACEDYTKNTAQITAVYTGWKFIWSWWAYVYLLKDDIMKKIIEIRSHKIFHNIPSCKTLRSTEIQFCFGKLSKQKTKKNVLQLY